MTSLSRVPWIAQGTIALDAVDRGVHARVGEQVTLGPGPTTFRPSVPVAPVIRIPRGTM